MSWHLHILWNDRREKSGNCLSPYEDIAVLLAMLLRLYTIYYILFTYYITGGLYLSPRHLFHPQPL